MKLVTKLYVLGVALFAAGQLAGFLQEEHRHRRSMKEVAALADELVKASARKGS